MEWMGYFYLWLHHSYRFCCGQFPVPPSSAADLETSHTTQEVEYEEIDGLPRTEINPDDTCIIHL